MAYVHQPSLSISHIISFFQTYLISYLVNKVLSCNSVRVCNATIMFTIWRFQTQNPLWSRTHSLARGY